MNTLEILSLLFALAAVFGGISVRWLRLPITVGTMLLTLAGSAALMAASSWQSGIHAWAVEQVERIDFGVLILHGMLPLLLFAGAYLLDLEELAKEKLAVSVLALAGTVACFLLVAVLFGAVSGQRLPWMECLLLGAVLSPTDPIAVLEMLRRVGVSKSIQAQLAGESLFNDGVGAVIFLTLLALSRGEQVTAGRFAALALVQAGGGLLLGVLAACVTAWLMRHTRGYQIDLLFSVALGLGGYALAERLGVSAPLEAVAAGITLRFAVARIPAERVAHLELDRFWEAFDELQNSILFVLLGLEAIAISLDRTTAQLGLVAIAGVNLIRLLVVALLLGAVRMLRRGHKSSALVLGWGGLRGGLSIALALSVPQALGRSWIVGVTYSVVVFSVLVQGSTMNLLLRRLSMRTT